MATVTSLSLPARNTSIDGTGMSTTMEVKPECLYPPYAFIIVSQVCSAVIGSFGLYMTISLGLHFLREASGRFQRRRSRRSSTSSHPVTVKRKDKFAKKVMNLQMINAAMCVSVRCCVDFVIMCLGYIRNPHYITVSRIEILLNVLALSSMYLVLWLRQWTFYNHPAMDDDKFTKLRFVCGLLIFIMVATGVWNATAFLLDRDIEVDQNGCIVTYNQGPWSIHKFYVLGGCTLFYQVVLLFLFAYPLWHHASQNQMNENRRQKSILRVLKRVFIAALLCCVTDLITTIISVPLESKLPESSFIVYNFNIISNFLCLLYTFGDWKLRVFYLCIGFKDSYPKSWATTVTSHSNGTSPNNEGQLPADCKSSTT